MPKDEMEYTTIYKKNLQQANIIFGKTFISW